MEILFKAKRADGKGWVKGNYFHNFRKGESHSIINFSSNEWFEVIPETICQFTGLTDKNGNRVFHDDLVKDERGRTLQIVWHNHRPKFKKVNGVGDWWEHSDFLDWCDYDDEGYITDVLNVEITGNIHN